MAFKIVVIIIAILYILFGIFFWPILKAAKDLDSELDEINNDDFTEYKE